MVSNTQAEEETVRSHIAALLTSAQSQGTGDNTSYEDIEDDLDLLESPFELGSPTCTAPSDRDPRGYAHEIRVRAHNWAGSNNVRDFVKTLNDTATNAFCAATASNVKSAENDTDITDCITGITRTKEELEGVRPSFKKASEGLSAGINKGEVWYKLTTAEDRSIKTAILKWVATKTGDFDDICRVKLSVLDTLLGMATERETALKASFSPRPEDVTSPVHGA